MESRVLSRDATSWFHCPWRTPPEPSPMPTRLADKTSQQIKAPPHSIEAEQSVLGGLMLDNQAWDAIAGDVIADDFYHRAHRLIFRAMHRLTEKNQPIDLVTVSEDLEAEGKLQEVGGFAYLGEI